MNSRWRLRPLSEVSELDTVTIQPREQPTREYNYVALENIESDTGKLIAFTPTLGSSIASAKYEFTNEHVLYGKLRPYLNKVFLPSFSGICATDIVPIRPTGGLSREFLAYMLRSPAFLQRATTAMTGTKMPRVRVRDLITFEIPVPPPEEQQRIVDGVARITERVETLRASQESSTLEVRRFRTALIDDVFSSPTATNWETACLCDLVEEIRYGTSSKTSYDASGVPVLRMGNIQNGNLVVDDLVYLPRSSPELARLLLRSGDVLVNRTNSPQLVGKSAIFELDGDYLFASYLIRVRLDLTRVEPGFVWAYLNSTPGRRYFASRQRRTTGVANINSEMLQRIHLPMPTLVEQRRLMAMLRSALKRADQLGVEQVEISKMLRAVLPASLDRASRRGL